ncbi:MAG: OmpA family protein, partial [Maritimibacter harenae]
QTAEPVSREDVADYEPIQDIETDTSDERALRQALLASMDRDPGRTYSLRQVRQYSGVRDLAPVIEVDNITFNTGSAVITASQAEELTALGQAIRDVIEERPDAVFLVEGHTDTVGSAAYNLALSDRRAESVALALTEYFDVPPENLITQGYGESELKVMTTGPERANRRANVRNITPLLQ